MTPGSPTPWENGLVGVSGAMRNLTRNDLPAFSGELDRAGQSNVSNQTTNNFSFNVNTSGFNIESESRAALALQGGI